MFQQLNFASASELTDDYFDIASNYFNTNNYAKAIEYLDNIIKLEPNNLQAQTLRNKILPMTAPPSPVEIEQATKILSTVQNGENFVILDVPQADIEKMNYNSDYYNTKGQEFYRKKEYNIAIEYFFKSIKLNSRNAQAYNNLAMSYWMKNDSCLAIKYFKKAHALNRGYTQPLVNLSLLYAQQQNEQMQVCYLQKAIRYNPNDYWAYYLLGDYYKSKMQYPRAIDNFKEAIKINNKFSQAYIGLALSYFETEEFKYAGVVLCQYIELNPDSDYAYSLMAKAYLVLGQFDLAKINIEKAITISDKPEYQYELAKIEYYLGDYENALAIFQILLQKSDSAEMFNYVGLCNYKLKRSDIAIANFNKAIELDALRPIYYYNLAQCYKSLGDKRNYVKFVNTATKINPINYQDFIDLSYIYYDNANANYAINTLNEGIRCYPTVKALYLSKLKIYEALGDNLHYNEVKNLINARFSIK